MIYAVKFGGYKARLLVQFWESSPVWWLSAIVQEDAMSKKRRLFRVKFQERHEKAPITVVVESFTPSEHFGLVCLEKFVFFDQTKFVVLSEEDEIRKRFAKTERLHLPYHGLISVEEFHEDEPDLKNLPFIRPLDSPSPDPQQGSLGAHGLTPLKGKHD